MQIEHTFIGQDDQSKKSADEKHVYKKTYHKETGNRNGLKITPSFVKVINMKPDPQTGKDLLLTIVLVRSSHHWLLTTSKR